MLRFLLFLFLASVLADSPGARYSGSARIQFAQLPEVEPYITEEQLGNSFPFAPHGARAWMKGAYYARKKKANARNYNHFPKYFYELFFFPKYFVSAGDPRGPEVLQLRRIIGSEVLDAYLLTL